ncbi:MAG: AI-2E family transporter [Candidatus Nanoarchaeia archaeon]
MSKKTSTKSKSAKNTFFKKFSSAKKGNSVAKKNVPDLTNGDYSDKRFKKIFATIIVVGLLVFLAIALKPFINAFLGAFIVFFLFRTLHKKLVDKGWSPYLSAGLWLLCTLIIIIVPLFFGAKMIVKEVSTANVSISLSQSMGFVDQWFPDLNVTSFIQEKASTISSKISSSVLSFVGNAASMLINLVIFFFVLFYMFVDSNRLAKVVKRYMPFSKKNNAIIIDEFRKVTNSTVIATGLIGLLQGIFMALGFYVLGVSNPVLWGFVSMIVAILPVIGLPVVWVPAMLFKLFAQNNIPVAIAIGVWGFFITNIDYVFLRPWMQRRMGKIHPLTSLVGIFMGIPIFGILGLVLGPLLLSYMILITKIYIDEYLIDR